MKLSEFLKTQGFFSKDIHTRIKNGQIKINGEQVKSNVELLIDIDTVEDLGIFLYNEICYNKIWCNILKVINIEDIIDSNISNDLTFFLRNFIIIRTSKTQIFIVEKI